MDGVERKALRSTRKRTPPSKPGLVRCLGPCGKWFPSPDHIGRRICPKCTKDRERVGLAGELISRAADPKQFNAS
jgi:hypothetical protein